MRRMSFALLASLLLGCPGGPQTPNPEIPDQEAQNPPASQEAASAPGTPQRETPAPPALRLGKEVQPTRYVVALSLDPSKDVFEGEVQIEVNLTQKTDFFWLHGTDLSVKEAAIVAGSERSPVEVVQGGEDFLGVALPFPVGPGAATLKMRYTGKIALKETEGLFRQKEGGDWYIFSQLEAISARRVFPCFDEPSFKTPWQLSITVPEGMSAFSNTPITAEEATSDGQKTFRFTETKPLPSYLIALAVGPFEVVDAGQSKVSQTPIRIITPRGKASEARHAAKYSKEVLEWLEGYFGQNYPFEKLDQIAIPETVGFGAMENPGLVTYNARILLAKPEEETLPFQRRFASVVAHELAHQWFGNLVTLAWWDDIWLNEAFATWMERKFTAAWKPEWETRVSQVSSRIGVMGTDSLITARRIRQPIEKKDDIESAFDGITYSKGAAVLAMFEAWVGEDVFQKGIRRYLDKHAHQNATASDFLSALNETAGDEIGPAFSTFLDQAGVPLVSAELRCDKGKTPQLALSQKRYLPLGSQGDASQLWQIPVCVRYGEGKTSGRECRIMTGPTELIPLTRAKKCPDWVFPNESGMGYYHVAYQGDLWEKLKKNSAKVLSLEEKISFLGDVSALTDRGDIAMGDALGMVPSFLKDSNRHLISSTLRIVGNIHQHMISDELRPNYARFIQKMYGKKAKALGFFARPGEDDDDKLMRPTLIGLAALSGEDKDLIAQAGKLARKWLSDRSAVDQEMVGTVLSIAARHGDRELFEGFYAEAKKTENRRERRQLLEAMGSFGDEEILKEALSIALTEDFEGRDAINIVWAAAGWRKTGELTYQFVKDNFDKLSERLPRDYGIRLAYVGGYFCDETHRKDVETFFSARAEKFTGGPRVVSQVLERIDLCTAYRKVQEPSVISFLKKY